MCDEVRSAGCAELPDGPRFRVTHRDHRLTVELSVPCDLLHEPFCRGCGGSDQDASSCGDRRIPGCQSQPGADVRQAPAQSRQWRS